MVISNYFFQKDDLLNLSKRKSLVGVYFVQNSLFHGHFS